jgi:DNA (cytosine-5)-methyltransferase 1
MTLTVGSLFTGIGGIDLGLERAGMRVVWQAEIDPYCCRVLAKHWPSVPNLGDVTTIDWAEVPRVDLICGGYPCQPFSQAEPRLGDADPRHLWPWMLDAIRVLRPRFALLENVPGHLGLGFDRVLADLATLGFDAEWSVVSACSVGASHMRRRLFCLAHSTGTGLQGLDETGLAFAVRRAEGTVRRAWPSEPEVARVADGIPRRLVLDPIRALGNAVVPPVAEHIGRLIMTAIGEAA